MILYQNRKPKVILDPGHGGHDPGAIGIDGLKEKDVVLNVCELLKVKLEEVGFEVKLTRTKDVYIKLDGRTILAQGHDALLSVHCNAFGSDKAQGIETIHGYGLDGSKALATHVQKSMMKKFPENKDRGVKASPSPGYPRNLHMVRRAPCPSALAELEFITHPEWGKKLSEASYKESCVVALYEGIYEYFIEIGSQEITNPTEQYEAYKALGYYDEEKGICKLKEDLWK